MLFRFTAPSGPITYWLEATYLKLWALPNGFQCDPDSQCEMHARPSGLCTSLSKLPEGLCSMQYIQSIMHNTTSQGSRARGEINLAVCSDCEAAEGSFLGTQPPCFGSIKFASERLMTALLVRLKSRLFHLDYCSCSSLKNREGSFKKMLF